jgi:hypothetical protein
MVLLLGYAAYIYFSGKGVTLHWLRALWQMVRTRWGQLRGAYRTWANTRLPSRAGEGADAQGPGWLGRWRNLGKLSPEQQVRYLYLATLEDAEQQGLPRRPGETPRDYAPRLADQVAPAIEDKGAVETLTSAFMRVRYGHTSVTTGEASLLQQLWQQIRQQLRRRE